MAKRRKPLPPASLLNNNTDYNGKHLVLLAARTGQASLVLVDDIIRTRSHSMQHLRRPWTAINILTSAAESGSVITMISIDKNMLIQFGASYSHR